MTRSECEIKLVEKWDEMIKILKEYDKDADYLAACYISREDDDEYGIDYYFDINNATSKKENALRVDINAYSYKKMKGE